MQSSSTLAVMVAGGVLIYALSKKSEDDSPSPGNQPSPVPGPIATIPWKDPNQTDPTIKGYHSGYPGHYPPGPFCAFNYGFKTFNDDMVDPVQHAVVRRGCDPSKPLCTGIIAHDDRMLSATTQEECIDYDNDIYAPGGPGTGSAALNAARLWTGIPGNIAFNSGRTGFMAPTASELVWYDPLRQTATYLSAPDTPTTFDASNWDIYDTKA